MNAAEYNAAGIISYSNVSNEASKVNGSAIHIGLHIYNCKNFGVINVNEDQVGGILGRGNYADIYNCENHAPIYINPDSAYDYIRAGGISGLLSDYNLINCQNTGSVIVNTSSNTRCSNYRVGGIVGDSGKGNIVYCYNTGAIVNQQGSFSGGICSAVTSSYDSINIVYSYNIGSVSGLEYVGGILGNASSGSIANSYNKGEIINTGANTDSSDSRNVGGIVGYGSVQSYNCWNEGKITIGGAFPNAYIYAGGIDGQGGQSSYCYNKGDIAINGAFKYIYAGGISASKYGADVMCFNKGNISIGATFEYIWIGGIIGGGNANAVNCYNTGNITSQGSGFSYIYQGGVVGYGNANMCYNTGRVYCSAGSSSAYIYMGGVTGYGTSANVSYNTGNVECDAGIGPTSYLYMGGVIGYTQGGIGTVYNTGDVIKNSAYISQTYVGGIAGNAMAVSGTYNTGNIINNTTGFSSSSTHYIAVSNYGNNNFYLDSSELTRGDKYESSMTSEEVTDAELKSEEIYSTLKSSSPYWKRIEGIYPVLEFGILATSNDSTAEITVENEKLEFDITTEVGLGLSGTRTGGTITGEYTTKHVARDNKKLVETVKYGDDATQDIEITPDEGYKILQITINEENYGFVADNSGKVVIPASEFTSVMKNYNVVVTFGEESKVFTINKVDENDNPIEGAKFKVESYSNLTDKLSKSAQEYFEETENGYVPTNIETVNVTAQSTLGFGINQQGNYYLKVKGINNSNGNLSIRYNSQTYTFEQSSDEQEITISNLTGQNGYAIIFEYSRPSITENSTVIITNVELFKEDGSVVATTNDLGQIKLELEVGAEYRVTELETPDKYILDSTPVVFTLEEDGDRELKVVNNTKKQVTAHYYLEETGPEYNNDAVVLANDEIIYGNLNEAYATTVYQTLENNYKLQKANGEFVIPDNATGKFSTDSIDVYYYYEKEQADYKVHYLYDGVENEDLMETGSAEIGTEIDEYTEKEVDGYKFEKTLGLPLTIGADAQYNNIYVYYEKDDFDYTVQYYYENDEGEFEEAESEVEQGTAKFGSEISDYEDKVIDGYRFKEVKCTNVEGEEQELPLVIKSDSTKNVIKVYYERDDFNYSIRYFYDGVENSLVGVTKSSKYLSKITRAEIPSKLVDGYALDRINWLDENEEEQDLPMTVSSDSSKNVINVYYERADYMYEVNYYYDEVKDEDATERIVATYASTIEEYPDKCIDGYKLDHVAGTPLIVTDVAENNVIDVYYVRDDYDYRIEFYYDNVINEEETEVKTAKYGDEITTYDAPTKSTYTLDKIEGLPLTISTTESKNVIKVYYTKNSGTITVKYIDNLTGEEISSPTTMSGTIGTGYEVERATFEGYRLDEDNLPTNETGVYSEDGDTVTYKYIELRKYELLVRYTAGNDEIDEAKIAIDFGDTHIEEYTTNGLLKIGDIELTELGEETYTVYEIETPEYCKTIADEQNPEIIQLVRQLNLEKNKYEFIANYEEREGFNVVIDEENKKVIIDFTTKKNEKYDLSIKKFISNIDGTEITNRAPEVTVTDEGKISYKGNNSIEQTANNQLVTYTVRMYNESNVRARGKKVIEYIPDGLVFVPDNEVNKNFKWKMCKVDDEGNVAITENPEEANLLITSYLDGEIIDAFDGEKVSYLDVQAVFKVDETRITSNDRIVENEVQIMPNKNDDNTDNDVTTEKLYVKYFDLSVEKYIANVKVKTNNDEKDIEVGYDKKDTLVKVDVKRSEQQNTKLIVTYGLLIKNVGEIPGYATEITDYIPQDFKLISTDIWTEEGNKVTTKALEDVLLNPGESENVEITFEWNLANGNIGSRINEAQITAYANEYDAIDVTEDNKDNEELLVTIKTGSEVIKNIGIATLYVSIVALGVLAIKRKVVIRK